MQVPHQSYEFPNLQHVFLQDILKQTVAETVLQVLYESFLGSW